MEWRAIETAPKDGTNILVCRTEFDEPLMAVARWDENMHGSGYYDEFGWMRVGYQGLATDAVTPPPSHWMPLPAPPLISL